MKPAIFRGLATSAALVVAAVLLAAATTTPAGALPSYQSTCTSCHGTASGALTATPATATPAAGTAYSVAIDIGYTSTGNTGYWISNGNAATPALSLANGPGAQTSWSAAMTAPSTPGTYTYLVWAVRGYTGQAKSTTYTITVPAAPVPAPTVTPAPTTSPAPTTTPAPVPTRAPDSAAPATQVAGAADGGWYNAPVTIALSAADGPGGSGVASVAYSIDGRSPVVAHAATTTAVIAADALSHRDDGVHTLAYLAIDAAGNFETVKTLTVYIDTQRPTADAPRAVAVRRGRTAVLPVRVADAQPGSGVHTVVVEITTRQGRVVGTLQRTVAPGVEVRSLRFSRTLRSGAYRYTVHATDGAGNAQAAAGWNRLTVR